MNRSVEVLQHERNIHNTLIPQELFWPLLIGLGYFYTAAAGLSLRPHAGDAPTLWFANAVAMFILLSRPVACWPVLVLTTALAALCAPLFIGVDSVAALTALPAHLSELLVGALLLKRFCHPEPCITQVEQFLRGMLYGSLIPAPVGGGLAARRFCAVAA